QDHRVFFRRVEARGLENPALDAFAVEAVVPKFFWCCQVQRGEQSFVHSSDLSGRGEPGSGKRGVDYEKVADVGGRRDERDDLRSVRARGVGDDILIANRY